MFIYQWDKPQNDHENHSSQGTQVSAVWHVTSHDPPRNLVSNSLHIARGQAYILKAIARVLFIHDASETISKGVVHLTHLQVKRPGPDPGDKRALQSA